MGISCTQVWTSALLSIRFKTVARQMQVAGVNGTALLYYEIVKMKLFFVRAFRREYQIRCLR